MRQKASTMFIHASVLVSTLSVKKAKKTLMYILFFITVMELTPLQVYERDASARQVEVGQLRKTGEAHRKRVKLLEQEVASQRIIAKVSSGPNVDVSASCVLLLAVGLLLFLLLCRTSLPRCAQGRTPVEEQAVCFFLTVSSLVFVRCASSQPNRWEEPASTSMPKFAQGQTRI